jgi:hypothetical protein
MAPTNGYLLPNPPTDLAKDEIELGFKARGYGNLFLA